MPTMNMGRQMSDEDLRRLAEILQSRGEGLASINQGEANLLSALGGSGQALPGTQGLGVSGGPIRSYDDEAETTSVATGTPDDLTTVAMTEGSSAGAIDTSLSDIKPGDIRHKTSAGGVTDGGTEGKKSLKRGWYNGINYGSEAAARAAKRTAESEGEKKRKLHQ